APTGVAFTHGTDAGGSAISPDGGTLAFVAESEGTSRLWIRSMSSIKARPLIGTEGAHHPFWSPDSRSVGFFTRGKLKRASLTGEAPLSLCDAPLGRGASWSSRGLIAFAPAPGASLHVVSEQGGASRKMTRLNAELQENAHLWPYFLPDGRDFIYLARSSNPENTAIYLSTIDEATGDVAARKRLLTSTSNAVYSEDGSSGQGHLLFVRDGKLHAQPFESYSKKLSGASRLIADQVGFWSNMGLANFSVSRTGVIAYSSAGSDVTSVALVSREGRTLSHPAGPDSWFSPKLSRDGKLIAIARTESLSGRSSLWLVDLSRGGLSRLTTSPGRDGSPVWSPDGGRIVFLSVRGGPFALFSKSANGSGAEQLIGRREGSLVPFDWSSDGRRLLVGEYTSNSRLDVWIWPLTGSEKPHPLLATPADELEAQFSNDSRWIAFTSDESGRDEVYVQSAVYGNAQRAQTQTVHKRQVSTAGGGQPKWRADGKQIFYRSAAGVLTSVDIRTTASGLVFGTPQPLFPLPGTPQFRGTYTYDSSADGQRFVILSPIGSGDASITILTSW
ncbi:MAG TPA: hypothetical protein VES20_01875, partial [Bryobacteraceae bacterium]|nr:hypothetical protein [Bryobacteraceae bacterium]